MILHHNDNEYDLAEIVQKELKDEATDEELECLKNNAELWKSQLIASKKACENQFVASKARLVENHHLMMMEDRDRQEYMDIILHEKKWKVNAVRFLQQIESSLHHVVLLTKNQNNDGLK